MKRSTKTDDRRWEQVLRRANHPRTAFVFGVRTTGIYCRSGCPARTPNRENVLFFGDTAAAEAGGFRACKRCRPADEAEGPARRTRAAPLRDLRGAG